MSANQTARTNGTGNIGMNFGNIAGSYVTRIDFGISKNMDAGMVVEFGNYTTGGGVIKYAFLNQDTGPSWAMEIGFGNASESSYTQLGNIMSLNVRSMEVFWNARIVSQELGPADYTLGICL